MSLPLTFYKTALPAVVAFILCGAAVLGQHPQHLIKKSLPLGAGDTLELNQVIVTGIFRPTRLRENPLPLAVVSTRQIERSLEDNLIDALSKQAPGLDAVKTGPNVSKPFINGLGYNRVLTLFDGMRVETQQWGDEHGVPVDDYNIERAEVIRGPASLLYGSDALAGVVSLFPPVPMEKDGRLKIRYLSEYQHNNGLIGNAFRLGYSSPHWYGAFRGSERFARNYTNPIDGRVYNTGFRTINISALLGYDWTKGYSQLNATLYDNSQGIPDGSRDSLTRKFTYQVDEAPGENVLRARVDDIRNRPIVPDHLLSTYQLSPLHQRIQDYRLYTDNVLRTIVGEWKLFLGWERNIRREYNHPTAVRQAGMDVLLTTLNYGLRYNAPTFRHIEISAGINGMYQRNRHGGATDFPIPGYQLFDFGSYGYAKWKAGSVTIAGGLRYDHRRENGRSMYIRPDPVTGFFRQTSFPDTAGSAQPFTAFTLDFEGLTGSLGLTWLINDHLNLKANIGRGYRAPNITEIAANGLDPGAHIYYIGNKDFRPEFSLQEDISLEYFTGDLTTGISIFHNYIQHFIYESQAIDAAGNPLVIVPGNKTFQYRQTNARLYGGEVHADLHPVVWKGFHFLNRLTTTYGVNLHPAYTHKGINGRYLPFIPPARWLCSVSQDMAIRRLPPITAKVELDYNTAQQRYLGLYDTETPTAAYALVNVSLHATFRLAPRQNLQLHLQASNLLNTAYQSHLSRLKYFEYYTASPTGRPGIYNMGRNLCAKVIWDLD